MHNAFYFSFFFLIIFCSCHSDKGNEDNASVATILPDKTTEVEMMTLIYTDFHNELISNGRITSSASADLFFLSAEVITHIWVKNGEWVKRGQKLAELDKFKLNIKYVQAKDELERAHLELQDVLIGQGYSLNEGTEIPEETMRLAKVKSGYDRAYANYELVEYELKNTTLVAPFDGVVANLFSKPDNMATPAEVFCTVIDNRHPEVDFTLLESELFRVKEGDRLYVSPFSDKQIKAEGNITAINPVVDTNGMVKVKGRLNNASCFFDGMNVRVIIQQKLCHELVIPKSALVLRSGKQVVFTYREGQAFWNYVETGPENSDSFIVREGLKEGDRVIINGNVNLAHESEVVEKKEVEEIKEIKEELYLSSKGL